MGGAEEGLGGMLGGLDLKVCFGGDKNALSRGKFGVEGEECNGAAMSI